MCVGLSKILLFIRPFVRRALRVLSSQRKNGLCGFLVVVVVVSFVVGCVFSLSSRVSKRSRGRDIRDDREVFYVPFRL